MSQFYNLVTMITYFYINRNGNISLRKYPLVLLRSRGGREKTGFMVIKTEICGVSADLNTTYDVHL